MHKIKLPTSVSGIALPMVLIFVVIMMLIGATAIRNATMGEKMAGNSRSQQLAFQAAEQALRFCENAMITGATTPVKLTPAAATAANLWDVAANWTDDTKSTKVTTTTAGVKTAPRCMVENMTDTMALDPTQTRRDASLKAFRITARGTGASDNAVVLLQSYLKL
ncbi:MAG: PilX N-terminal domain-containing pilus assembly protein [Glaciimonas sp.]|nr:PilX N-terminal domain-containing pilus assembly protein [Glaciimonas sp.]